MPNTNSSSVPLHSNPHPQTVEGWSEPKPRCSHGWTYAYLVEIEAQCKVTLRAWEDSSHPFRAAGIEGARKALATVQAHIAECSL
jgi:hypothetical protein